MMHQRLDIIEPASIGWLHGIKLHISARGTTLSQWLAVAIVTEKTAVTNIRL